MRLLVAAFLLLLPTSAQGWALHQTPGGTPLRWSSFPVWYRVAADEATEPARVGRALRRGAEAWGLPATSPVALRYQGPGVGTLADEGVNTLWWHTGAWPPELGEADLTAAATVLTFAVDTGVLRDVDVVFNAATFKFGDDPLDPDALDLWTVAAHETGHLLGLDHNCGAPGLPSCTGAPSTLADALMFPAAEPGQTHRRAPAADDLGGLEAVYGAGLGAPPEGLLEGGCGGQPARFLPTGEVPPASFEAVVLRTGARLGLEAEADGEAFLLDTSPIEGASDLVIAGASGKARTLHGVLTPEAPCVSDPAPGGCDCGGASTVLLLTLAGLLRGGRA